jgi:L-alanine-DL-glutamate epimerase-like enolase superfamily enzyme
LIISGAKTTALSFSRSESSDPVPACLVELDTSDGLTGIAVAPPDIGDVIEKVVRDTLCGADPRAVVMLWQDMSDTDADPELIAALDIALWDLKAKANGEPLWKTLGGMRPRVNAYTSEFDSMPTMGGFHEGKLKLNGDFDEDLRRIGQMRESLSVRGRVPTLMVDSAGRWTTDEAIENISRMEAEFDLTWVQEPVPESDIPGLKRVSDNVAAAVCAGGRLYKASDYLPYFQEMAMDIVQIDIARTGITGALQIADTAYGLELPVTLCASPGNVAAHVAAVLPNFMSLEVVDARSSNGIISSDVRIERGRAIAGDALGNGLAVDPGALG